jgi:hypothetical protein
MRFTHELSSHANQSGILKKLHKIVRTLGRIKQLFDFNIRYNKKLKEKNVFIPVLLF